MPRNNAPFPGGPGSPRSRQSTPRCSGAPIWCPVGASLLLGPSGLYVHYIRTSEPCQGVPQMTELGPEPSLLIADAVGPVEPVDLPEAMGGAATEGPSPENPESTPPRRGVAGWIVYDLGNTLFSQ